MYKIFFRVPVEGRDPITGKGHMSTRHLYLESDHRFADGKFLLIDANGDITESWYDDLLVDFEVVDEPELEVALWRFKRMFFLRPCPSEELEGGELIFQDLFPDCKKWPALWAGLEKGLTTPNDDAIDGADERLWTPIDWS